MLCIKKRIHFILLATQIILSAPLMATHKVSLDLEGDGRRASVNLPFNYYQRQDGDRLTLIHQGGYKVFDIQDNQNDVAVIGTLRPCIGIAVSDGVKLIAFHKHCTSSLESIGAVIRENLDSSDKTNLYARIYTTRDDIEWVQNNRQQMHGGKTHLEEVKSIKDFLNQEIGIIREQIPAELKNLRNNNRKLIHAELALGRYELAEFCVAVRLNDVFETIKDQKRIKFAAIDPHTEDVFGYKGTQITEAEYAGPNLLDMQTAYPGVDFTKRFMSYDQIPQQWEQQSGEKDGYRLQRGISERRLQREEGELYLNYFGKPTSELFVGEGSYNSLDFYPIVNI